VDDPTSLLGRNKVLCLMQKPYRVGWEEKERERKVKKA